MTAVERLYILLCGYEVIPKSVSTLGHGQNFMICAPICVYVLKTSSGWIMLDTGLDPFYISNQKNRAKYFYDYGVTPPIIRKGHDLEGLLAQIGIGLDDISQVVISHLHYDHSGYIKKLPNAVIHMQEAEYTYAMECKEYGYFTEDFASDDISWCSHNGDWSLCPGLDLLATCGHTPGHQSAIVTLPWSGKKILTFDAGDLRENFTNEMLPGVTYDAEAALASIQRINTLAQRFNAELILFHDPQEIQKLPLVPNFLA